MPPFVPRPIEWISGDRITLLEAGKAFFPALCTALDGAREEIHLATYIFANDATGAQVADTLRRAAARGIAVNLLVDGFGSHGFAKAFGPGLAAAGVRFLVFRGFPAFWSVHRLHRKVAVVDRRIAFVGGINIVADPPARQGGGAHRHDYALQVEGPLALRIGDDATRLWNRACWSHFKRDWRLRAPPALEQETARTPPCAALLVRAPIRHRRDIERAHLAAFAAAKQEILLAHAYFLPGRKLRQALLHSAKKGVKVTLLLPGVPDHWLAHHASEAMRGPLLRGGIRMFAYQRAELHAKVAVVDGHWLTVGSSNIDPLSFHFAHEANVVAEDAALAALLKESLLQARNDATEITWSDWQHRPWPARLLRWAAYLLVRTLFSFIDERRRT